MTDAAYRETVDVRVTAVRSATDPAGDGRLTRLAPRLWWYRDTCNVYLWAAGSLASSSTSARAASSTVLDEIGVREIVAVAHTHHHRDQCGGDDRAVALGIPIWVPAREPALFEATDAFWRLRRTYDSYDASSLGVHARDVGAVARRPASTTSESRVGGRQPSRSCRHRATRRAPSACSRRSTARTSPSRAT